MALSVGTVMTITVTVATVVLLAWYSRQQGPARVPFRDLLREFIANRYYVHAAVFPSMALLKLFVDRFNDPVKSLRGNFTGAIHWLEGNVVFYIQRLFESPALTAILNFHYLFIYALLFVLTPVYFMYVRERDLADKAMMNYVVIYVLAVPYYLFFNVDVTSTYLPGMKALLYHHSALYFDFFATSDPLDNAFPSLHIAIPTGLLMIHFLHCRQADTPMRTWTHWPLQRFIAVNALVFAFSILYLGIHWITDIIAGVVLALIGALAVHAVHPYIRKDRQQGPVRRVRGFRRGHMTALALGILVAVPFLAAQSDPTISQPTMHLGPGDIKTDVIGPVPDEGPIQVHVTVVQSDTAVEALFLPLEEVEGQAEQGRFNWTALSSAHEVATIPTNASLRFEATTPDSVHVLLVHDPRRPSMNASTEDISLEDASVVEVQSVYPDARVTGSVLMSLPSFAIVAATLHRQWHLRRAGLPWTSDRRFL